MNAGGSTRPAFWAKLLLRVSVIFFAALLLSQPAASQPLSAAEHSLKAAFIYRFIGHIDWPPEVFESGSSPFVIAVRGDEKVRSELQALVTGRLLQGRPLEIVDAGSAGSLAGVHVLYLAGGSKPHLREILGTYATATMLLITEFDGALDSGSVINFLSEDRRLRFEISLESSERKGLKLSSRLLAVAARVHTVQS